MSPNTERVVLGLVVGVLIIVALTYAYLLIRREPGSRYTRVGVFFERDRVEEAEAEDDEDTKIIEKHWPGEGHD